jgi:O-6-methylguanine DNA methyltransferase
MTDGNIATGIEDIATGLRALRASAPRTLAPAALVAAGLADAYAPIETPFGPALVTWNARGVSSIAWPADPDALEARFPATRGRPAFRGALPAGLGRAIQRRLAGDRRASVPLDLRGSTPFEQAVWAKALEIPRGEVRPYGWVAAEIGRPAAVRAVGTALGHNPVPLVVPCHRVVRSDGTIGQYSMGGPENKRRILRAEGLDPDDLERQARAGIRYLGSATTRIVCLPSCHHARRISATHRVPFRTLTAATGAGFRACRACRPAGAAA